jgi:hypothetical protein
LYRSDAAWLGAEVSMLCRAQAKGAVVVVVVGRNGVEDMKDWRGKRVKGETKKGVVEDIY